MPARSCALRLPRALTDCEVKFGGFRIQLHKAGDEVRLSSRNGKDFTDRFPSITAAVRGLGAKSAAIDGELVSCDWEGKPDFYALMRRRTSGLCVWCFDLLTLNERDLRSLPLEQRKAKLGALLAKTGDTTLRLSQTFDDGEKLLLAAARQGLEGIVKSTVPRSYCSEVTRPRDPSLCTQRDCATLDASPVGRNCASASEPP